MRYAAEERNLAESIAASLLGECPLAPLQPDGQASRVISLEKVGARQAPTYLPGSSLPSRIPMTVIYSFCRPSGVCQLCGQLVLTQ